MTWYLSLEPDRLLIRQLRAPIPIARTTFDSKLDEGSGELVCVAHQSELQVLGSLLCCNVYALYFFALIDVLGHVKLMRANYLPSGATVEHKLVEILSPGAITRMLMQACGDHKLSIIIVSIELHFRPIRWHV